MAVNRTTLDNAKIVRIMVDVTPPGPFQAAGVFPQYAEAVFHRITIDDTTYWEPGDTWASVSPTGLRQRGQVVGQEMIGSYAQGFPIAKYGDVSRQAVWSFPGI